MHLAKARAAAVQKPLIRDMVGGNPARQSALPPVEWLVLTA